MKVTATLQVLLAVSWDDKAGRWRMGPEDLSITIHRFRGPLYSRKQLLDLLLQTLKVGGASRGMLLTGRRFAPPTHMCCCGCGRA